MRHLVTYHLVTVFLTLLPASHGYPTLNGTAGQNLSISFSFTSPVSSNVSLYRNSEKVLDEHESKKNLKHRLMCVHRTSNSSFILHFRNLNESHSGVYHLTVFPMDSNNPLIESNKVNLTIHTPNITSTNTPTVEVPGFSSDNSSSHQINHNPNVSVYIPLLLLLLVVVIITSALCFRIFRTKSDENATVTTTAAQQVAPVVSCVDYCVLDFPNRPPVPARVRNMEERVEYASLSFPQRRAPAQQDNRNQQRTAPPQDVGRTTTTYDVLRKPGDRDQRKAETLTMTAAAQRCKNQTSTI